MAGTRTREVHTRKEPRIIDVAPTQGGDVFDILIIMNNYFHDVATATLLAAAVIMWVLERQFARDGSHDAARALSHAYPTLTRFAQGALVWIVLGGIPRVLYFNSHDLGAIRGDLVPAIIVKHAVEVVAVLAGVMLWRRAKKRIEAANLAR